MTSPDEINERKTNLEILARARSEAVLAHWRAFPDRPAYQRLRGPETGLVMVRGRAGGGGAPFNLGEATVTRASVRLDTGETGHAYALGRDLEKVETAAVIDALWQRPQMRDAIASAIIAPLGLLADDADARRQAETAATRVNFFTLVRGED